MVNYKDKCCTVCGITFKPTSPKQKACFNKGCRDEVRRQAERSRYKKVTTSYSRECRCCRTTYTTSDSRKVYCGSSECEQYRQHVKNKRADKKRKGLRVEEKRLHYQENKEAIKKSKKVYYREVLHPGREVVDGWSTEKLKYDEVCSFIDSMGYTMLSECYENNHTKIDLLCPENHYWSTSLHNFKDCGNECPRCSISSVSKVSQRWLDSLNIKVREHYIKKLGIRVDGFDPKTSTVYEFLGDYWHGNPERFKPGGFNKTVKKSFGTLFKETQDRIELLKENGYRVVYIWESDFKEL